MPPSFREENEGMYLQLTSLYTGQRSAGTDCKVRQSASFCYWLGR